MNPLSIQHAVINELELNTDASQPTIEVKCEWNGRTVKKHVPDIGNTLLNELVTGKIEEPAVKPALERLLGRTITKAEEKSPETIIRTVVQKCISESNSSGTGSLPPNPFAESSTNDGVFAYSDSEKKRALDSFIAKLSWMNSAKDESVSSGISEQDTAQYIESLLPTLDESQKTRRDKRETGEAFTVVAMEPTSSEVVEASATLLNTLPDEVLDSLEHLGWDPTKTERLPIRQKQNPISDQAVDELTAGTMDIKTPSKGRYLGRGGYGTVKFAVVTLNDDGVGVPKICVAKKMHLSSRLDEIRQKAEAEGKSQDELETDLEAAIANQREKMLREIAIQNHAGADISPVIYGYSHTLDKNNEDLLVVFMEPAAGINGEYFFRQGLRCPIGKKRQLLLSLLEKVQELQNKNIFHNDYKLNNCSFDPKTLNSWILDFGLAKTNKTTNAYAPKQKCFYPPEMVEPNEKDAAKIDVYQLGVLLTTVLGTDSYTEQNPFFLREPTLLTHWSADQSLAEIQEDIDRTLDLIKLPNESSKELIRDMIAADPGKRITLNEAIERFKEIHWEPDTL